MCTVCKIIRALLIITAAVMSYYSILYIIICSVMIQNKGVYQGFYVEVLNFENLFLYSYIKVKFYIAFSSGFKWLIPFVSIDCVPFIRRVWHYWYVWKPLSIIKTESSIKQLIKCKVHFLYSNPRFHLQTHTNMTNNRR